ncbi:MAG TPA: transglycosylase domain-containing protein [Burkholderiaceae bacterium]|nr:transglycosylase domain-containing protein [Burkholderiaceae bacterium]
MDQASPENSFWTRRRRRIALWSGGVVAALAGAFGVYLAVLVHTTPDVEELRKAQTAWPSVILSADGEVIGRFSSAYQAPIALKDMPPDLIAALISTEDHRFYEHHGLDPTRIAGSAWGIAHGRWQGGSTITQQLARNLFPQEIGNDVSITRKLREAITAVRLERTSTKEQILENYLNVAPFLYNVRGIEMASRTYFGKPASQLDTAQAATLVGMLKGSQRYNPVRNPERARQRRNVVLAQMAKHGKLSQVRYEQLRALPLALDFRRPEDGGIGQARHFVEHLREQLAEWADANDRDLDRDGLVIHTTLDSKLQKLAQDAVTQQVALLQQVAGSEWSEQRARTGLAPKKPADGKNNGAKTEAAADFAYFWRTHPDLLNEIARDTPQYREARQATGNDREALARVLADGALMTRLREAKTMLSAGFVAMEPGSGAVRAWVGSPDFNREQFDHVIQARRQPGSTFKPFVYGAALQRGISTEHRYLDAEVDIVLSDGKVWRPSDGTGASGTMMTLREGLVQSKNTITAQVMNEVGVDSVIAFAQAAGVHSKLDPVPSLALGTSPVTLLEMTNAYATLAALGEHREPLLVTSIAERSGRTIATFENAGERVIDPALAGKLVDVMRGVPQTGTATLLRTEFGVQGDVAGKTGTTQNNTDGWFLLMQPNLVAGAWVGFNDPRVTIRSNYWGQGGHNALRIVGDFFRQGQKTKVLDAAARFPDVPLEPAEFDRIEAIPLGASGEFPLGPPAGPGPTNKAGAAESVSHTLPPNPAEQRLQDLANGR